MGEKTVAELLREAAAALDEQRDAGSETATNMPAPDRTGEGHANRVCHFSARIGYFSEITSLGGVGVGLAQFSCNRKVASSIPS